MFNSFKLFILVFVLSACGKNEFFSQDKTVVGTVWDYKSPIDFEVDISDTVSYYDFYVDFRHNDNYEYSDIYLLFDINFPNNKKATDTLHIVMQDYSGKWLGKNSGSIIENHVLIKPKTGFPVPGKYKFRITQAMRDEKLKGIEDVGLTISKRN